MALLERARLGISSDRRDSNVLLKLLGCSFSSAFRRECKAALYHNAADEELSRANGVSTREERQLTTNLSGNIRRASNLQLHYIFREIVLYDSRRQKQTEHSNG